MIIDIANKIYWNHFTNSSNPYISEWFVDLVKGKVEKVLLLMDEADKSIGLVAGLKDGIIQSPFSAPFGGLHYSHEHLMYDTIYNFILKLKEYVEINNHRGVNIILPPDIYQTNMNAKFVNAFIRAGYKMNIPNIINWLNLSSFDGTWVYNKVTNRCKKAIKSELQFKKASNEKEITDTFELIKQNRIGQGREIHMTLHDLMEVSNKIPVDFFQVNEKDNTIVGAGVLYRGNEKIIQAIFMGDDLNKRDLGAIDFLYMNIYSHYKNMNYKYIDFGTSSLDGEPNIGLLRFKEIHNCETSIQLSFTWTSERE